MGENISILQPVEHQLRLKQAPYRKLRTSKGIRELEAGDIQKSSMMVFRISSWTNLYCMVSIDIEKESMKHLYNHWYRSWANLFC